MSRFLVIEARRLLPLLFLLVLLVSLSVYDNFFRVDQPVTGVEEELKNVVSFVTADRGELPDPVSFQVIENTEQWEALHQEYRDLPDYPYNAAYEYAVCAVNGEISSIQVFPQGEDLVQVQVRVQPQTRSYHVITVERQEIGDQARWLFLDPDDHILAEIYVPQESPDVEQTEANEEAAEENQPEE